MISQTGLLICSLAAVWFSTYTERHVLRWVQVFGLAAQPFWFYDSYVHAQWGIFAMSFVFTGIYFRGFYIYWLKGLSWRRHDFIGPRQPIDQLLAMSNNILMDLNWAEKGKS